MTKEKLKQIASELRSINEKLGDILKLKKDFEVLKETVLNEKEVVRKDISDKIENVKKEIEEVKFKAEIKKLDDEEKKKLLVSCVPTFERHYPPSVKFEFSVDNRFEQSFILDRLFYTAYAGARKEGMGKTKICSDVYFDKIVITESNKTSVSKIADVTPITCDKIDEMVNKEGFDIEWEIKIEMSFEGDDGLKLLSPDPIDALSGYRHWEGWYTTMKKAEHNYWKNGMKRGS